MSIFLQTFESVAMLLFIGVVGFWILSRRMVPATALQVLGRLALEVALPCLVFVTILRHFDPTRSAAWWSLPLWWVGFTVLAGGMTYLLTRIVALEHRPEFGLALFYQNATFFPLAVLTQLYGAGSPEVVDLFLFVTFFGAFLFSTYRVFYGEKLRLAKWRTLLHPVFVVTVLAVVLRLTGAGASVPEFVVSALEMIGEMTVPLLMLILGGSIYLDLQEGRDLRPLATTGFVAAKNILFPALTFGVIVLVNPPRNVATILMLQAAVPPVTSAPVLVTRENGDRALASQFLVGSFIASLVSIPGAMWLLEIWIGGK